MEISKPPYPYSRVGPGPGRSSGPTTKYGTRVPSAEVAKYWRTVRPAVSKSGALCLTLSLSPPAVPR